MNQPPDDSNSSSEVLAEQQEDSRALELYTKDEDGNFVPFDLESGDLIAVDEDGVQEVFFAQRSSHSGPLPSVEQFRAYGEVLEDAPERILQMAENEQSAYHSFMDKQLTSRMRAVSQGQWMGFVLMLVALVGAIYLAYSGYTVAALALASPAVIFPIMRFYFQGKQELPKSVAGRVGEPTED